MISVTIKFKSIVPISFADISELLIKKFWKLLSRVLKENKSSLKYRRIIINKERIVKEALIKELNDFLFDLRLKVSITSIIDRIHSKKKKNIGTNWMIPKNSFDNTFKLSA